MPYKERVPHRKQEVRTLCALFPGLLRPKQRRGFAVDTELALRLRTPVQVEAWRYAMLQGDPGLMVLPQLTPP